MKSFKKNSLPFVTVIIPFYNDLDRLRECLICVFLQTYPHDCYEVIVVDNGSDEDFSPLQNKFHDLELLYEYRPGSYAARNTGIRYSKGEVLAFTDSDCLPAHDWIEKGVIKLASNNIGVLGGRVNLFYKNESNPTAIEIFDSLTFFRQQFYIEKFHFSVTANLFTFRYIFEEVGLFNSHLMSGGDFEWCNRVYASGFFLDYAEDVIVKHPALYSFPQIVMKVMRVTRGRFKIDFYKFSLLKISIEILSNDFLPPVNRIRKIWLCKHINGYSKKAKVIFILLIMKYISSIEKFSLLVSAIFR